MQYHVTSGFLAVDKGFTAPVTLVFDRAQVGVPLARVGAEGGCRQPHETFALVGIRLKKYDWVEEFLINYKKDIPMADREGLYVYLISRC